MSRPFTSPDDQSATFVELFFDLVFVFGVTQIVGLLHHDLSWVGVGHAILVFWLVWWAWTQFTWALNAADTTHPVVELVTLIATGVAFFMSVGIPASFAGRALWFAVPYVLVRGLGLWLYGVVARADPEQHRAVRLFTLVSTGGLVAVIAGALAGPTVQPWLWAMTIFLDVVAALVAGQEAGWGIHAEHFAERHGLIVIIALGESLIVAAAGLAETSFTMDVAAVALTGVLISCALWWTYFPVAKPELEHALARVPAKEQGALARDVFSLAHFPMLCGVVAYAVALEEAVAHPADALPVQGRLALAIGPFLFVGGTALAMWRATCGRPVARVVITGLAGAAVFSLGTAPASISLGITLAGVVVVAAQDERRAERMHPPSPMP